MSGENDKSAEGAALVEAYLNSFPEELRERMGELRRVISEAAPEAIQKISYAMPTWYYRGNLVHFACFARHIGFYPGAEGIAAFEKELGGFKHAKGSVQFPHDSPLPLDLVRRIAEYRYRQNREKPAKGKRG